MCRGEGSGVPGSRFCNTAAMGSADILKYICTCQWASVSINTRIIGNRDSFQQGGREGDSGTVLDRGWAFLSDNALIPADVAELEDGGVVLHHRKSRYGSPSWPFCPLTHGQVMIRDDVE